MHLDNNIKVELKSFKIKYNPMLAQRMQEMFALSYSEDVKNAAWDQVE